MPPKKQVDKNITALLSFDDFFKQYPPRDIKKRTTILNAGITPNEVFYIKKGYARSYSVSSEGEELTMVIFQPGDFFPLISTINPTKLDEYIESITEMELIPVPWVDFMQFLNGRPDLLREMFLRLTARFEGVLTRMEYLVFGTASQKIASIIIILGERFGEKKDSGMIVKAPMTHKDLASLVGITRETTTLILNNLIKKGLISFQNKHILIRSLSRLHKESLIDHELG